MSVSTTVTVTNATARKLSFVGDNGKPAVAISPVGSTTNTAAIHIKDILGNELLCEQLSTWITDGTVTVTRGAITISAAVMTGYAEGSDMNRVEFDTDDSTYVDAAEAVTDGTTTVSGADIVAAIGSGIIASTKTIANAASPYTVLATDVVLFCNSTAGIVHLDFPTAVGIEGKTYIVIDKLGTAPTYNITLHPNGGQTIDGESTLVIKEAFAAVEIVSNGANWLSSAPSVGKWANKQVSADHTVACAVSSTDTTVLCTSTGGAVTVNLPSAAGVAGRVLSVLDVAGSASTYNITINRAGAETIDGATTVVLREPYECVHLVSNGTNWFRKNPSVGKWATKQSSADHTVAYAVLATDATILCTSTGGAVTVNLPSAAGTPGRVLSILDVAGNASTNNITINRAGAETIDGATSVVLNEPYECVHLVSNGTNWFKKNPSVGKWTNKQVSADHTVAYNVLATDSTVLCNSTGGAVSVLLPTSAGKTGRKFTIMDAAGFGARNNITITPNGAETIDGLATSVLKEPFESVELVSNGSNWFTKEAAVRNKYVGLIDTCTHAAPLAPDLQNVILANSSGGAVAINLPTVVGRKGKSFLIIDSEQSADTFNITVTPNGAETIDGAAAAVVMNRPGQILELITDGVEWFTKSHVERQGMRTGTYMFSQAVAATVSHQAFYAINSGNIIGVLAASGAIAAAGESMSIDININGVSALTGDIVLNTASGVTAHAGTIDAAHDNFVLGDIITIDYVYVAGGGPTPMLNVGTSLWFELNP
jgi:hypothetical protein